MGYHAYANPYFKFQDGGNVAVFNICQKPNKVPNEYYSPLNNSFFYSDYQFLVNPLKQKQFQELNSCVSTFTRIQNLEVLQNLQIISISASKPILKEIFSTF
ncbi:hypothetical protein ABPG73_007748 [Tetrahymena malaccensis]